MTHQHYFEHLQVAPVNNGLHYRTEGQGQTLLFLHGALANGYTFRKILPALSRHYRCITLHLPLGGHHIPLSRDTDLSPPGIADLIRDFMVSLEIEQAVLIANDTGGAYAQVFAAVYPEMVTSLILSNCEVTDVFPPSRFIYLRYAARIPGFTFLMAGLLAITPWLTHPSVMGELSVTLSNEDLATGYIRSFVKNHEIRKDFAGACRHWHPRHTLKAAKLLENFSKPVLVLWGDMDQQLFPRHQMEKLLKIFPHAEWMTIAQAKTFIQEDAPEQTVAAIDKFLKSSVL